MKKLLTAFCVLALALVCLNFGIVTVSAADALSGKCGENLKYSLNKNGVMTISGTGKMWDFRNDDERFDYHKNPWDNLRPKIKSIVFKSGITYIGASAFEGCVNLSKVTFTDTITTIESFSFLGCTNLGNFVLPRNLQSLCQQAFDNCDKITKAVIPDTVTFLDANIFNNCDRLTDVYIGGQAGVGKYIHANSPIGYCPSLEKIKVSPDNIALTAVDGVLYDKNVTTLVEYPTGKKDQSYKLPATTEVVWQSSVEGNPYVKKFVFSPKLKVIDIGAFRDCDNLKSANIPNSVTTIGDMAFLNCDSLTTLTIGNSVTTIGNDAFCDCDSLTSVSIPASVSAIGQGAFSACNSLASILVDKSNPCFSNDAKGVLFDKTKTTVLQAPGNLAGKYKIPSSVSTIRYAAFSDCDSLISVTIPDSVTTIGDFAFHICSSLTNVTVGDRVTTIGDMAFEGCDSLKSISIPGSVTAIGEWSFGGCDGLTEVTIDNGVTAIGNHAFTDCVSLKSIDIPDSVTIIDDNAFAHCSNLTAVYFSGSKTKWNRIKFGEGNEYLQQANIHFVKKHTHSYKTTVKKATFDENGEVIRKCAICGKVESTKTILRIETVKLYKTAYAYNGKAKTPTVIVKDAAGKTLKKDVDYTVSYASGRKNVGTYRVTVKMKGNYTGTKVLTFKIKPISISKCSAKLFTTSYVYNGKVKTPTVTVKDSAGKTLKKGADYTVTYAKGRKNVGTYKVTVKMKGNYTGTKVLTFKIVPKAASINKLTAKSKAILVKLNRVTTQSTGYQIQYSTSSKFTSAKTVNVTSYKTSSKTISGLKKGKKYYVRVRTYKTIGKTKFYSAWSSYKSVKTK